MELLVVRRTKRSIGRSCRLGDHNAVRIFCAKHEERHDEQAGGDQVKEEPPEGLFGRAFLGQQLE